MGEVMLATYKLLRPPSRITYEDRHNDTYGNGQHLLIVIVYK